MRNNETTGLIERLGKTVGKRLGRPAVEVLKGRVNGFEVNIRGLENLSSLKGKNSYLIVSNHIKPEDELAAESGIGPDALIIGELIKRATGKDIASIQKSDNGWNADSKAGRFIQEHIGQPFGKGLVSSIGNIPWQANPGSLNLRFYDFVESKIEEQKPILIFPEGRWYDDWDSSRDIKIGAARLARRYGLTILPIYINGANSWETGTKVDLSIGEPFDIQNSTLNEVTNRIKGDFTRLQAEVINRKN
jgi:hypothetical protein